MSHVWLPFTQMRGFDPRARTFVRGSGTTLEDARGAHVYDAVSSIWTIVHGHCHPRIVDAIARQAAKLDHATLLGATNPVAETLAERLCALAGHGPRILRKRRRERGRGRDQDGRCSFGRTPVSRNGARFVRLRDAYHGDTVGAMSVSDIAAFQGALCGPDLRDAGVRRRRIARTRTSRP